MRPHITVVMYLTYVQRISYRNPKIFNSELDTCYLCFHNEYATKPGTLALMFQICKEF